MFVSPRDVLICKDANHSTDCFRSILAPLGTFQSLRSIDEKKIAYILSKMFQVCKRRFIHSLPSGLFIVA